MERKNSPQSWRKTREKNRLKSCREALDVDSLQKIDGNASLKPLFRWELFFSSPSVRLISGGQALFLCAQGGERKIFPDGLSGAVLGLGGRRYHVVVVWRGRYFGGPVFAGQVRSCQATVVLASCCFLSVLYVGKEAVVCAPEISRDVWHPLASFPTRS